MMSKKTELINLFAEYKKHYETIQAQVIEINGSLAYTEIGRQQAIQQLLEDFQPTVKLHHDQAVQIINDGLDGLAEKWKNSSAGKLLDGGYQAGLANIIKMLEMGVIRERDDIQNIIDTYAGDFNALAMIAERRKVKMKRCAVMFLWCQWITGKRIKNY